LENGSGKTAKTDELLGYSSIELQNHIMSHSKYDKCVAAKKRICIDHIFPLKAFEDYGILTPSHIWLINHLTNLQPSIISWNSSKNDLYCHQEFEDFLRKHGVSFATY